MKRISFISGTFPSITGGEFYNYQLYSHLKENKLEVNYINLHQLRLIFKLNLVPVLGDILSNLLIFLLVFPKLGDLVVEDQYYSPYLVLTNFFHKFIRHGKTLLILHHFDKYSSEKYGGYPRPVLSYPLGIIREIASVFFADFIITNSQFNRQEILSVRSIDKDDIKVLPPGLDREKLKAHVVEKIEPLSDQESPIILCVGHCIPRKGIIHLIEAVSRVNRKGFKIYIVGKTDKDANYYQNVLSLIDKHRLSQDIFLLNRVDQETLISLYKRAKFFVLPSLKEGFGIVLLEAMYYGLPIITTNVSAMPELVINSENGLLVNPADSDGLAHAISTLIEHPELCQKMSENGSKKIAENYYWEQTKSQFLSIIQNY